ncbi:MAG: TlyA family RNA methyltransferase, partial [Bdellovibrionales bacterium]|nr:TlyA family RNA methyltransferase [Bdellovibrionales bacterium]
MRRKKLFHILVERGFAPDKEEAIRLAVSRQVVVDGVIVDNPESAILSQANIRVVAQKEFVSRGALKLLGALRAFSVSVAGKTCADFGASTGGFTDVLLQRGAHRVYAVDTAKNELDWKIRSDNRVIVMDATNVAYLESLPEDIHFISVDISLVPVREVLPAVWRVLSPNGRAIVLVKPQYELGQTEVPSGGVVVAHEDLRRVCQMALLAGSELGFAIGGIMKSPITGGSGNREFLVLFEKR